MKKVLRKKFPLFESNPYLATFFGMSLATCFIGFVFFVFTYLLSGTNIVKAEAVEWFPPAGQSILEVHIANNGLIFLQGARVESISGTIILVSTSWDVIKLKWIIHTNESYYGVRHFGTDFFDSKGNRLALKDIYPGSVISINGTLNSNYAEPTVKADIIRVSY